MKKRLLVILGLVILLITALFFWWRSQSIPEGLTKVPGYKKPGQVICAAIAPECGVCFGEVVSNECYVDTKKLSDEELQLMNLK